MQTSTEGKVKKRAASKPKSKKVAKTKAPDSAKPEVQSNRDEKGRIKPGCTLNAGGLPKGLGEVKKLARQYTAEAINTLVEVMQDKGATSSARVGAATALLDRGYGKPTQQIEVGRPGDFSDMAEDEIDAFIKKASLDLGHLHMAEAERVAH